MQQIASERSLLEREHKIIAHLLDQEDDVI